MSAFDSRVERSIAAEVRMISGCHDTQTSADVSNVTQFDLPNPCGRAGGACTAALLEVLYRDHHAIHEMSWVDILRNMRSVLNTKGFHQVPQLSSSRIINLESNYTIVNPLESQFKNPYNPCVRRAVLIGINYTGQTGELSGCHNDVKHIKDYLKTVHGFENQHMTILLDDDRNITPTRANIMSALRQASQSTRPGDTLFVQFSGHGGQMKDKNGDEEDGYDETIIPVDFQHSGQIIDDLLLEELVKPLPKGSLMTCLFDCCHSGTVLDLPYRFTADGDVKAGMVRKKNYFGGLEAVVCCFFCFDVWDIFPEWIFALF